MLDGVSVEINFDGIKELERDLDRMGRKQLPFALVMGINNTAPFVEAGIQSGMAGAFITPSPYVKRATYRTRANKQNPSATIGLKDKKPARGTAPAVLLGEHFTGGVRGNKPYEKALISLRAMPRGWRAIPGAGMKKNTYGNPSRKQIGEMLGALRSNMQIYRGRGKRMKAVGYFVVPVGADSRLHPGVYLRLANLTIKPMMIFVRQAAYSKVIDLGRIADEVVGREFNKQFSMAFDQAIRTAR